MPDMVKRRFVLIINDITDTDRDLVFYFDFNRGFRIYNLFVCIFK